jgi:hypothetical protein
MALPDVMAEAFTGGLNTSLPPENLEGDRPPETEPGSFEVHDDIEGNDRMEPIAIVSQEHVGGMMTGEIDTNPETDLVHDIEADSIEPNQTIEGNESREICESAHLNEAKPLLLANVIALNIPSELNASFPTDNLEGDRCPETEPGSCATHYDIEGNHPMESIATVSGELVGGMMTGEIDMNPEADAVHDIEADSIEPDQTIEGNESGEVCESVPANLGELLVLADVIAETVPGELNTNLPADNLEGDRSPETEPGSLEAHGDIEENQPMVPIDSVSEKLVGGIVTGGEAHSIEMSYLKANHAIDDTESEEVHGSSYPNDAELPLSRRCDCGNRQRYVGSECSNRQSRR